MRRVLLRGFPPSVSYGDQDTRTYTHPKAHADQHACADSHLHAQAHANAQTATDQHSGSTDSGSDARFPVANTREDCLYRR